ncbi:MAG: hypothetical protein GY757_51480 [bacterium]|nr:hypothetical protein [bacterium]
MTNDKKVITGGTPVSPGEVTGPVRVVKVPADARKIKKGDIMVVLHSNPAFAVGVMRAAGLICERGGMLTHICIVAKELGIPCVARAKKATQLLRDEDVVTLDAAAGEVYG